MPKTSSIVFQLFRSQPHRAHTINLHTPETLTQPHTYVGSRQLNMQKYSHIQL